MVTRFWDEQFQLWVWMCQVVFTLSDEHKHVQQPAVWLVGIRVRAYLFLFLCGGVREGWLYFSSRGEWQRTGIIGSSLSPQTGRTFHHRGISFQFSKPRHTSDAINKVFLQTLGGKMQVSSYLIIPLISSWREPKCFRAVRGKKTMLECIRRRRQVQLSHATLTFYGQYDTWHQATPHNYQRTDKVTDLERANLHLTSTERQVNRGQRRLEKNTCCHLEDCEEKIHTRE